MSRHCQACGNPDCPLVVGDSLWSRCPASTEFGVRNRTPRRTKPRSLPARVDAAARSLKEP